MKGSVQRNLMVGKKFSGHSDSILARSPGRTESWRKRVVLKKKSASFTFVDLDLAPLREKSCMCKDVQGCSTVGSSCGPGCRCLLHSSREVSAGHGSSESHSWKHTVWSAVIEKQQVPGVPNTNEMSSPGDSPGSRLGQEP